MNIYRRVIPGALVLALSFLPLLARDLSFEDRVKAQEAIERIYYAHQIGATKPFEAVVSRAMLEKKVRTYLEESSALDKAWHTPLTTDALAREIARMGRNTRLPDRLREIYSALGNDRQLILECLARPALADRLSRNFSASGSRTHEMERLQGVVPIAQECSPGDFWNNGSLDRLPDARFMHTAVWTGTEMIVWGGEGGEGRGDVGIRYDPATDTWSPTSTTNAPEARYAHSAVWTGTEMIVWGGRGLADTSYLDTGGRYDPTTDTWSPTSTTNAPTGRYSHSAVWTGTEMIVWSGYDGLGGPGSFSLPVTGGRYDPATDTWSPTSTADAPTGRLNHTAVWTGTQMIVWGGGIGILNTGGRYDPATDTWTPTSTDGAPVARFGHTAVWTGSRMVVWGGNNGQTYGADSFLETGGQYDPVTDTWTPTSTTNAPEGRGSPFWVTHTAVWTGTEMIVWGGTGEGGYINSGGRYDPAADTWALTAKTNAPAARAAHTAVWTGSLMIVWGGYGDLSINSGGRYDPATDSWTPTSPTSTTDAPAGRVQHTAVWTGTEMIVWGGFGHASLDTGGRYDPAIDTWTPTSTTNAPSARYGQTAVWTGTEMIVWGGNGITGGGDFNSGGRYDPIADSWAPTSTFNAPAWRDTHTAVWTGTRMIVWGGLGETAFLNDGGLYDPATDSWSATSMTGAPDERGSHAAVWTGTAMIVWGGSGFNTPRSTGGRYDPATDTWTPTSTTNAPLGGIDLTAVWSGHQMIVWGAIGSGYPDTPGRYDPATDTWLPISRVDSPGGSLHTAVWTGREMIVWGGVSFFGFTDTGGRYDPETDTWSPTTTTGAPAGRIFHTAVWTGTEMIVWGGRGIGDEEYLSSGGRYTPGTSDTPVLTLVAAPAILWPPNHKMVTVHITGQIVDACDPHPALTLVSVTSSEPDDATGAGDGHTLGDIAGADIGSPDMTIALRAERDGIGPGRVYTITYRVVDALGNSTLASTIVTVPHDQSGSAGDDGGDRGPHHGGHESPPGKHHHAHGNGR